jgi:hypothetical protein
MMATGLTANTRSAAASKIRRQYDANMHASPIGGFVRLAEPVWAGYRLRRGLDTLPERRMTGAHRTRD